MMVATRLIAGSLLLLAILGPVTAAEFMLMRNQTCPACNCGGPSCPAAGNLVCSNGGYFPPNECLEDLPCPGWAPSTKCSCTPDYDGLACDIVKPTSASVCRRQNKIYDGTILNTAEAKYLECQAVESSKTTFFGLKDHRLNITMDLPNRAVNVALWTRVGDNGRCGPMKKFFNCTVSDCLVNTFLPDGLASLTCPSKKCSYCTVAEGCPVVVAAIIRKFLETDKPMVLSVNPSDRFNVAVNVTMTSLIKITIPTLCKTGTCVSNLTLDNDVPPMEPVANSDVLKIAMSSSMAVIMYLGLAAMAAFVNIEIHHPPAPIKKMLAEHSLDRPRASPTGGYVLMGSRSSSASVPSISVPDDLQIAISDPDGNGFVPPILVQPPNIESNIESVEIVPAQAPPVAIKTGQFGMLWRNVSYQLPASQGCLRRSKPSPILDSISGTVLPGEMVAILGASGAGKSTLLDIVGGIAKQGVITGDVQLFGDQRAHRRDVVSYIVQDDYNLSTMTVWETLAFSARTRLPAGTSDAEIMARVVNILEELSLVKCATSMVGTVDRGGISGGERRRLAVGVELIADPKVLLADEPTSGLDSFYADMLIRVLRQRAVHDKMAVLLTIHQPPAHLFNFFHKIILMCKGGTVAFNGTPSDAILFFEAQSGVPMLSGANPFEYLVGTLSNKTMSFNRGLASSFKETGHSKTMDDLIESNWQTKTIRYALPKRKHRRISRIRQCELLTKRSFRHAARDPSLLLMYNCVTMAVAFVSGCIFYGVDNRIVGTQNRIGFLFFTVLFLSLLSMSSMGHFVLDRVLLWRERSSGFYSTGPYFASKIVVDLIPFRILPPILYSCIAYWMVGLRPEVSHFLRFVAILVLTNMVAGCCVFFISAASSEIGQANLVGILFFIYAMVFGGLLLNASGGNPTLKSLSELSFIGYSYDALMSNEFHELPLIIDPKGMVPPVEIDIDGDIILKNFGFSWDHIESSFIILTVTFLFINLATYFVLKHCQTRRK